MPFKKYVIGTGALLQWALASWAEIQPELELIPINLGQDAQFRFDLSDLQDITPEDATAFVVWNDQFVNFRRIELMGAVKAMGFRMPPLICKSAIVAASAKIAENAAICEGAIISANCQVAFNSVVGAGVTLGHGAQIGHSTWINTGAHIGANARVGAQVTLGQGVHIAEGITIGKQAIVKKPGFYEKALPAKSFYLSGFQTAISIIDYS